MKTKFLKRSRKRARSGQCTCSCRLTANRRTAIQLAEGLPWPRRRLVVAKEGANNDPGWPRADVTEGGHCHCGQQQQLMSPKSGAVCAPGQRPFPFLGEAGVFPASSFLCKIPRHGWILGWIGHSTSLRSNFSLKCCVNLACSCRHRFLPTSQRRICSALLAPLQHYFEACYFLFLCHCIKQLEKAPLKFLNSRRIGRHVQLGFEVNNLGQQARVGW